MTGSDSRADSTSALVADEIAVEQAHVDRVYAELEKASERAGSSRPTAWRGAAPTAPATSATEEMTGLFERDALVFHAARRRRPGRRSTKGSCSVGSTSTTRRSPTPTAATSARSATSAASACATTTTSRSSSTGARPPPRRSTARPRSSRWACCAAGCCAARAPPSSASRTTSWSPEAPDDLVVVGDGALMAALTRSRGRQMRDIVATIQRHQDEAIRASARGHHRDHRRPRHRQDGRRPAPCRLPALLRAAPLRVRRHPRRRAVRRLHRLHRARAAVPRRGDGDAARRSATSSTACSTERLDTPAVAAIKGVAADPPAAVARASTTPCRTRRRSSGRSSPGRRCGSTRRRCDRVRSRGAAPAPAQPRARRRRPALAEAAWRLGAARASATSSSTGSRTTSTSTTFMRGVVAAARPARGAAVARRRGPRYAATPGRARRRGDGGRCSRPSRVALDTGTWSVADVALVDDLAARLGPVQDQPSARSAASTRSRSSTTSSAHGVAERAAGPSPDRGRTRSTR